MDKFLSSHFDLESPEYYPEDFPGAAPGDGIIYISSEDEMESASSASVDDLDSLSDDDKVAMLAQCVETQMELPAASESIPVPSCSSKQEENYAENSRLSYIPGPMFNAGYFDLGMGRGPVARDPRLRNEHPINICSQLIPMVDTPLSPPLWTSTQQVTAEQWQRQLQITISNVQVVSTLKNLAAMTTLTSWAAQTA